MSSHLFSEFPNTDFSDWTKQVNKEIKKNVEDLVGHNQAFHFNFPPYQNQENISIDKVRTQDSVQKDFPGWLNMPLVSEKTSSSAIQKMNQLVQQGAQAILLNLDPIEVRSWDEILIKTNFQVPIFIQSSDDLAGIYNRIHSNSGWKGIAFDPLAMQFRTERSAQNHLPEIAQIIKQKASDSSFFAFMVESHVYHNAGATQEQELALTIAALVYYLDYLTNEGLNSIDIFKSLFLSVSVGTSYFSEIGKLRALRILYQRIQQAYEVPLADQKVFINARTSSLYFAKTLPHTNILRSTSMAMSAITGGCDSLTIAPFDNYSHESHTFSERIALNISNILDNESYVSKVADPAAGSYLLEDITSKLVDASWGLFLDIEKRGGIMVCFENEYLHDLLDSSWQAKKQSLKENYKMVGVNKYFNEELPESSDYVSLDLTSLYQKALTPRNLADDWFLND